MPETDIFRAILRFEVVFFAVLGLKQHAVTFLTFLRMVVWCSPPGQEHPLGARLAVNLPSPQPTTAATCLAAGAAGKVLMLVSGSFDPYQLNSVPLQFCTDNSGI